MTGEVPNEGLVASKAPRKWAERWMGKMRSPGFEPESNEDSVAEIASLSLLWQNKSQIKLFFAALVGTAPNLQQNWDSKTQHQTRS